jgi:hypothetical protein
MVFIDPPVAMPLPGKLAGAKDPLNLNRVRGSPLAPRDAKFDEGRSNKSK